MNYVRVAGRERISSNMGAGASGDSGSLYNCTGDCVVPTGKKSDIAAHFPRTDAK